MQLHVNAFVRCLPEAPFHYRCKMGSLMAGWNSPVLDPKSVKYKRNRSLTKEEIEAYWKSKRDLKEEHLKADSMPVDRFATDEMVGIGRQYKRSSSFPAAIAKSPLKESFADCEVERKSVEKLNQIGWWTRSNSAFLNEPPVLDGAVRGYAAQYDVVNVASSKFNQTNGVGA